MELDNALLLILGEVPTQFEGRFNEWYDDHAAERLAVPGIVTARRYKQESIDLASDSPSDSVTFLTFYELANLDVLDGDAYKALSTGVSSDLEIEVKQVAKFDRRVYRATATPNSTTAQLVTICGLYLLCVWQNGGADQAELSQSPGILRTRCYRLDSGRGGDQLTIYDVESRDAVNEIIGRESFDNVENAGGDSGAAMRLFHLHRRYDQLIPSPAAVTA